MKKFISTIPLQPEGQLKINVYSAADNEILENSLETRFPIMIPVSLSVKKDEEITFICIVKDNPNAEHNLGYFKEEADALAEKIGFKYNVKTITVPDNEHGEDLEAHLDTFEKLIDMFEDNDILTACTTYGTKPTPMVELMGLSYAKNVLKNVYIDRVVYGRFDHSTKKAFIHDITSLFYMNEIISKFSPGMGDSPKNAIKALLGK